MGVGMAGIEHPIGIFGLGVGRDKCHIVAWSTLDKVLDAVLFQVRKRAEREGNLVILLRSL